MILICTHMIYILGRLNDQTQLVRHLKKNICIENLAFLGANIYGYF